MDFARKQLEKYGWTDGKGLGKNENGISEALKPKLKRSITGIGYDPAKDFTEHWWSALYDKAAGNVQVEEKNGKTKKIKQKDEKFEITNSTWKLKKKSKEKEEKEYSEFFIKTAVIDTDGTKTTKAEDSDSDDAKEVVTMTDEELFAACQGRTAHKGARHGLRALGKLARIEEQERLLLQQSKYRGYSHTVKIKTSQAELIIDDTNLNSDLDTTVKKKKKKKKRCCSNDSYRNNDIVVNDLDNEKVEFDHAEINGNKKFEVSMDVEETCQDTETDVSKIPKKKKKKWHNSKDNIKVL